jgi:sensor histidine kinase YesM
MAEEIIPDPAETLANVTTKSVISDDTISDEDDQALKDDSKDKKGRFNLLKYFVRVWQYLTEKNAKEIVLFTIAILFTVVSILLFYITQWSITGVFAWASFIYVLLVLLQTYVEGFRREMLGEQYSEQLQEKEKEYYEAVLSKQQYIHELEVKRMELQNELDKAQLVRDIQAYDAELRVQLAARDGTPVESFLSTVHWDTLNKSALTYKELFNKIQNIKNGSSE